MRRFFSKLLRRILRGLDPAPDWVDEFHSKFPGRCMICSFHAWGYGNGMTNEPLPPVHKCEYASND
jgi:hypothetical protein